MKQIQLEFPFMKTLNAERLFPDIKGCYCGNILSIKVACTCTIAELIEYNK